MTRTEQVVHTGLAAREFDVMVKEVRSQIWLSLQRAKK